MTSVETTRAGADVLVSSRMNRALIAVVRIGVALLWIQNVNWKRPPEFGDSSAGLRRWTELAISHEVFAPYTWVVDTIVLPNFVLFGWGVLLVEGALGAFLLIGFLTRFWALIGIAQTVAITLSVLNAPHEWHWAYLLMLLVHIALFATAAGRYAGMDGVVRPTLQRSDSRWARLVVIAS